MPEAGRNTIGIIGGGLQGAGLAIELSLRGFRVELFEKRDNCLSQASMNNEGKVHLGLVYAKDKSLETARLMSCGAFRFAPLLERWLESRINLKTSLPFHYVVHRQSQVAPAVLEDFYGKVTAINNEYGAIKGNHYLGRHSLPPMRRLSDAQSQSLAEPSLVSAVFESSELAVDPVPLNRALRDRLADDPAITVHTGTRVTAVTPLSDAVELSIVAGADRSVRRFDHVINAAWEDLVYLDDTAGIPPRGQWNFRVKHYLRGRIAGAPAQCPSATIVLGPFGDVVQYADGNVCLSWYPVGRRRWSQALRLDEDAMALAENEKADVRQGIWDGLARLFPATLGRSDPATANLQVEGGVILALGTSDVDHKTSQLHERSRIGPRSFGRYHSVDTGKWTMAPFFAETLAGRIADGHA
jgi:glycine/D-amino acid oxidase-like deaminating enzyme